MNRTTPLVTVAVLLALGGCATQKLPEPPAVIMQPPTMEERVSVVEVTPLPDRKPLRLENINKRPTAPAFNPAEVRWFNFTGTGTIKGNATVTEGGFGTNTCAGARAYLIPASAYSEYRMEELYGDKYRGYNPIADGKKNVDKPDSRFVSMIRSVECDEFGEFMFENLADGEYYVTTPVRWDTDEIKHGGNLMQRVTVSGGLRTISLSN